MTKEVFLRQVKNSTLAAKADSGHWVMMDTKPEAGGSGAAASPKELLLMALAGCTSMDVVSILKKKRSPVAGYECIVKGEEAADHPRRFISFHIEYIVYGDGVKSEDVERAIELSTTKYCSVSAQLSPGAEISHSYRIESAAKLDSERNSA